MKPKSALRSFLLATGSSLLAISYSHADQTWDGTGGDNNWNTATNWGLDALPNFASPINFAGNTRNFSVNDLTADTVIGGINFTNNGSAGQTNGFVLSGNRITLGGDITTTINTTGTTNFTDEISLAMILNGTRTITTNQFSASVQHNLILSGNISSSGAFGIIKAGGGILQLKGTNSYTGATTLTAGTLSVSATANLGDAASDLVFNGGTLQITGTALSSISGLGRTNPVTFTAAKAVGLDIQNASHTFTVNQVLNQTTGSLTKSGAGTLVLNQTNTFTGSTTATGGGKLVLDYSTNNGSHLSNTAVTGTFALNGSALELKGGSHLETVLSTSLGTSTGNTITRNGGTSQISLGGLTINGLANLNIAVPSGADPALATTTTGNTNGILPLGRVTVGTDFGANDGSGNIVAYAIPGGAQYTAATVPAGNITTVAKVTVTGTESLAQQFDAYSIKFVTAGASDGVINIGGSLRFRLAAGGTYLYAGGGTNNLTINGGGASNFLGTSTTPQSVNVNVVTGATLTVNTRLTNNVTGSIAEGYSKFGEGTLVVSSTRAMAFTGPVFVQQGVLRATVASALGAVSTGANGTTVQAGAALELSGGVTIGGEALTIDGVGISNGGALRNFSGSNTYGGAITIGASGARINSDTSTSLLLTGGILTTLTKDVTFGGAGSTTVSTTAISGGGSVIKDGNGTTTLSVANTYNGATNVNGGMLTISSGGTINTTSGVIIAGGNFNYNSATALSQPLSFSGTGGTLSGNGTISTPVTITSGNNLSPGNSPGIINFAGGLTIAGGGILNWENNTVNDIVGTAGTNWDRANVTGITTIDSTAGTGSKLNLQFTNSGTDFTTSFWDTTRTYASIILSSTSTSGIFDPTNISIFINGNPQGVGNTISGEGSFTTALNGNNLDLVWSVAGANNSKLWVGGTEPTTSLQTTSVSQDFGRVLVGSTQSATVALNSNGSDASTTNATVVASGSGISTTTTSPGVISTLTGSGINATLSTASTGTYTGTVTIDNQASNSAATSQGSDNGNATINVTGTVVNNRVITPTNPVNLGRVLVSTAVTGSSNLSLTSAAADNVATRITVGNGGTDSNGLGFTVSGGTPATIFDGSTSDTRNLTGGTFTSTGAQSGTVTLTNAVAGTETAVGATPGTTVINYSATAVATRTVNAPTTTSLGTYHAGAAVSVTSNAFGYSYGVGGTGANANTENTTVQAYGGAADANGITLSGGVQNINSASTFTRTFSGTAVVSSSSGSFSSTVNPEFSAATSVSAGYTIGVYSGQMVWSGGGGTYATGSNWTDSVSGGAQVAPGLDAGFTGVDTATFNGSGGTVALGGSAPSLNAITFANANAYTVTTTGGTIAMAGTTPTITTTAGSHTIDAGITGSAGLTKAGNGSLTLTGTSSYIGTTLVSAGTLFVSGSLASDVSVSDTATLGGGGTVGAVSFGGGSFFDIFAAMGGSNPLDSLNTISFAATGFGIDNLVYNGGAVDWTSIGNGTYTLITGILNSSNLGNFGLANAFDIDAGGPRSAYFEEGSLNLVVIPEPRAALLGGLGMLMLLRRRRN